MMAGGETAQIVGTDRRAEAVRVDLCENVAGRIGPAQGRMGRELAARADGEEIGARQPGGGQLGNLQSDDAWHVDERQRHRAMSVHAEHRVRIVVHAGGQTLQIVGQRGKDVWAEGEAHWGSRSVRHEFRCGKWLI